MIKKNKYDELYSYHQNSEEIKRYFAPEKFELNQNFLQNAEIFKNEPPLLKLPKKTLFTNIFKTKNTSEDDVNEYDLENAIKLYESLPLNRVQAFQPELWAYLCHGPFYEYVRNRFNPNINFKEYKIENFYEENKNIRDTIKNFIEERFFTKGIRGLRRNGIASLWWAVELTHTPWERYEGVKKKNKDKYHYTEIILNNPNIYQQTFERAYGRETSLIFHLLDFIHDNKLGRSEYETLIKKLNSDLSYKILSIQSSDQIIENIEKLYKNS